MQDSSVAVIVRTKDRPRFLERALANIAEQTYPQIPVSYTHLRAHETSLHLVFRLLLEKKKKKK